MPHYSRRSLLRMTGSACLLAVAGCVDGGADRSGPGASTPTDSSPPNGSPPPTDDGTPSDCFEFERPRPTDAGLEPLSYPDRPDQLNRDAVASFVQSYERAYQYNEHLAEDPHHFGRRNEMDVWIQDEVDIESEGGTFTATVTGQVNIEIDRDETTPDTPTPTPLPIGHDPFTTTYQVSERQLRREGVVHECW